MNILQIIIWAVIIAAGIGLYIILKPKLEGLTKPEWKDKALQKLKDLEANKKLDDKYRILELDKIMEFILQSKFNSTKSFGEILKENEKEFDPTPRHQIWVAHKLRNKIVHDMQYEGGKNEFAIQIKKYSKNIKELLK
jgi:hypothetical protein